jgi:acetolactate synthase I/II/III large subunit
LVEYEVAEAFVDVLNANGVQQIFFNPGADTALIQATVTRMKAAGKHTPNLVMCLDESVAMTAAHGHYMISGRPQVVMVHAELGTLQVGGAMHNVQWGRVPVILWAGVMPGERYDWKEEKFEQNSIMRGCVKWDHHLTSGEDIYEVLQCAFDIAFSEPCGPVYLTYPPTILNDKVRRRQIPVMPHQPRRLKDTIDGTNLAKAADLLLDARNPLIVAGATGRYQESIASLIDLAQAISAPVLNGATRLNLPTTHPLCIGIEQAGASRQPNAGYADADVVLAIDYDMPYAPMGGTPKLTAAVVQIAGDPTTQGRPLWTRGADLYIKGDSRDAIPALTALVRHKTSDAKKRELVVRFDKITKEHTEIRHQRRASALSKASEKPISSDWLCHCISNVIDDDTIIVNHVIRDWASVTDQIDRVKPNTMISCAGGSIQWALAAAFGAKIAAPDKLVISLVSDGGFVWGCPVATLWAAHTYHAPFLTIIFNNQSYGVIRDIVQRIYGEEKVSEEIGLEAGVDISPCPDYSAVAIACGGYGQKLESPAEIMPGLRDAIKAVGSGKTAVLDVRLRKG